MSGSKQQQKNEQQKKHEDKIETGPLNATPLPSLLLFLRFFFSLLSLLPDFYLSLIIFPIWISLPPQPQPQSLAPPRLPPSSSSSGALSSTPPSSPSDSSAGSPNLALQILRIPCLNLDFLFSITLDFLTMFPNLWISVSSSSRIELRGRLRGGFLQRRAAGITKFGPH